MSFTKKILIIRLSSFGDIIQTLPLIDAIKTQYPGQKVEVDFLTKPEFKHSLEPHPDLHQVYYFDKKKGLLSQLREFNRQIQGVDYDYIYDAHNNLRSLLLRIFSLGWRWGHRLLSSGKKNSWIQRTKYRFKRFLFFKLRKKDVFEHPMIAAQSFITPLNKTKEFNRLELPREVNLKYVNHFETLIYNKAKLPKEFVVLAPSAAWPLKRWPTEYFQKLAELLPEVYFVVIGGPTDDFALEIQSSNVLNLVGKANWTDTGHILAKAQGLVSADTGVLHWSDYMGRPTIGILGPTAFGRPFRDSTSIMDLELNCSPCTKDGRGQCKIKETKKCLVDITPEMVAHKIRAKRMV